MTEFSRASYISEKFQLRGFSLGVPFVLVNKVKSSQKSSRDGGEQIPPTKILLVGERGKNSWVNIAKI